MVEKTAKKQWIPFKKYTGRQAFGFMKEAFFFNRKGNYYVVYQKPLNNHQNVYP